MAKNERRRARRIRFESQVLLQAGNEEVRATVDARNISLKGMYVQAGQRLPVHTPCRVTVRLTGSASQVAFTVEAKVCRHDDQGMGLAFARLSEDSHVHIKNLVRLNTMDDEPLEAERR